MRNGAPRGCLHTRSSASCVATPTTPSGSRTAGSSRRLLGDEPQEPFALNRVRGVGDGAGRAWLETAPKFGLIAAHRAVSDRHHRPATGAQRLAFVRGCGEEDAVRLVQVLGLAFSDDR